MTRKRKPVNVHKAAQMTTLYIIVAGMVLVILGPIFFVVSLSFLSNREAYSFPLPLLPALTTEFELTHGKRGYLLSVYDRVEGEYQTVLDTGELVKMSEYMKYQLGTPMTIAEIEPQVAKLETQDVVRFSHKRNLLFNYQTFFRVAGTGQSSNMRSYDSDFSLHWRNSRVRLCPVCL